MSAKPQLITALGRERMEKMIAYLRELPPERFDFGGVYLARASRVKCGTVGCVVGHCPDVFPELCLRDADHESQMRGGKESSSYAQFAEQLFELPELVANDLLYPDRQSEALAGIQECGHNATPAEVADMLASFLSQVDDKEAA